MQKPDLNLLYTLDVLLSEGSVARAAKRLQLSPSAMSRALARLREATGDPLLVRAGRGLVPTPRALELRERASQIVQDAERLLMPAEQPNLHQLERRFTLRTSDGFVENFGPSLLNRLATEAPGVKLRFVQKTDRDSFSLRDGSVDLETGVIAATTSPEIRVQALFQDRFVGVVRSGHPLTRKTITTESYVQGQHVQFSRRDALLGPVDDALAGLGLSRTIAIVVGGFSPALALARSSDLIATVPERHTGTMRQGMHSFMLPFAMAGFTVSMLWHPRLDADPAHRWLRQVVKAVCTEASPT